MSLRAAAQDLQNELLKRRIATRFAERVDPLPDPGAKRIASRFFTERYAKLLLAMSLPEAKLILGFPPSSTPSPEEVSKAYKMMVFKNHPDRGGDPKKMVEVNVAKDIIDKAQTSPGGSASDWVRNWYNQSPGGRGPGYTPPREERKPPPVVETIPGADFAEAFSKSGAPANVEWKCISKPSYARSSENLGFGSDVWTMIGTTDQKIWVVSFKRRLPNKYFSPSKGGNVEILEDWQGQAVSCPIDKDPLKILPKLVRSPSVMFADGTEADPPKKWVVWSGGKPTAAVIVKVRSGSGGANLKDILLMVGMVKGDAPGVKGRKSIVEIIPHYDLERGKRIRKEQGGKLYTWQTFTFEVRINGKAEMLSDDTIQNLDKNHFIQSVFGYDPPNGVARQLHKLRGGFLKSNAAQAIRLLADSLTSEASWLHIALEKAAEEWEVESAKTAGLRNIRLGHSLLEAAEIAGMTPYDVFCTLHGSI